MDCSYIGSVYETNRNSAQMSYKISEIANKNASYSWGFIVEDKLLLFPIDSYLQLMLFISFYILFYH